MRFFLAITALVAAVTAAPSADVAAVNQMAAMTLAEADASCGNGASLYCCDKSKQGGDTGSPGQAGGVGLLGAIVGVNGLLQGLLGQCSKININGKPSVAHASRLVLTTPQPLAPPAFSTKSARLALPAARTPPRS